MKFFIKLTLAFISRFKVTLFASVILGLVIFFLFEKIIPTFNNLKALKIGVTGRYFPEELPDNILNQISRGLTSVGTDGSVSESLATWVTPDGGKTWEFNLKNDIYWQDGKKLTTADVNYTFSDVETVTESESKIIFKLKDPFAPFPSIVAKPLFKKGLLGLGDWKVRKLKLNGSFVHELYLENKSGQRVNYLFYPTEEATKVAFKLGKVDAIDNILTIQPFDKWDSVIKEEIVNSSQVVTLFFNTQDKLLGDKFTRQALIYALDKNSMGERALSPISSQSWAYNPQVKEYSYDLSRAEEILENIPEEVIEKAHLQLVTSPVLLNTADIVAKAWNNLGIKTTVNVSSVIPTEFQVYLTILDLPSDPDQYPLWHSTQTSTNISKYASPRIDKLLEDGRVELNTNERKRIYIDFQRFLLEDVPAAFLYNPVYFRVTRKQ